MKNKISYSVYIKTLDDLYEKIKKEGYSDLYLKALKDAQNSLLVFGVT